MKLTRSRADEIEAAAMCEKMQRSVKIRVRRNQRCANCRSLCIGISMSRIKWESYNGASINGGSGWWTHKMWLCQSCAPCRETAIAIAIAKIRKRQDYKAKISGVTVKWYEDSPGPWNPDLNDLRIWRSVVGHYIPTGGVK